MKRVLLRFLDSLIVSYLKSQIETGNPDRTKKALQQLCKLYRDGFRIKSHELIGVEQSIVGLLYTQSRDEKVRRWALNTLARLGREPTCMEAITHTLKQYSHEPQTSAAAIAAIYKMSPKATHILKALSFDEQMIALAALQHVDINKLDLSALPLDVETASPDLLKLALVVVGLDRAPDNMMHPRHSNAELVKVLGGHDDNVISQYSVWAVTENKSLGLTDLGIDIRDIQQQPPNVRAWLYRLIAARSEDAEKNIEYIELGARDPVSEVRVGLATGLRDTFFDGIEVFVLDWFTTEDDTEVSQLLLDHMIRNFARCSDYEAMATEIYEKEPLGSALRRRMEAMSAGTALYGKLKQIDRSADLFMGVTSVTNNTYNIGNIQGGAVSVGGDSENSGSVSAHYNSQTIVHIQTELSKLERELHEAKIDEDIKKKILEAVQIAKADPSPNNLSKAVSIIRQTGEYVLAGTAIWEIGHLIAKLAGLG